MTSPLITIITPTYNAEKFIGQCIASVERQSFSEYEHIIIDGASTDNTVGLVRTYQQRKNNVKLVVEKDKGIYDAMNKGIALASGAWLYFLGADDIIYEDHVLEVIADILSKAQAKIVYGDVFFERFKKLYDGEFDIEKILTRNVSHQAVFYHASVFRTIGLYDLRYSIAADYDINIRCWLSGDIGHQYIPLTVARFADGGSSASREDQQFTKDYPDKTVDALFSRPRKNGQRINILSAIYRKIAQRYSLAILMKRVLKRDHLGIRFAALAWMILTLPFRVLNK